MEKKVDNHTAQDYYDTICRKMLTGEIEHIRSICLMFFFDAVAYKENSQIEFTFDEDEDTRILDYADINEVRFYWPNGEEVIFKVIKPNKMIVKLCYSDTGDKVFIYTIIKPLD